MRLPSDSSIEAPLKPAKLCMGVRREAATSAAADLLFNALGLD
jgi:hypothetical protein